MEEGEGEERSRLEDVHSAQSKSMKDRPRLLEGLTSSRLHRQSLSQVTQPLGYVEAGAGLTSGWHPSLPTPSSSR